MKLFKNEDKKALEPVFCTKQPAQLLVSKVPCPKPTEIISVATDAYCQSEKIAWCESPVTKAQLRDKTLVNQGFASVHPEYQPHFVNTHLAEILQNPRKDLVICNMDERVGKGLLLSPAATSPIKKGEIIGLYPGELSQNSVVNNFLSGVSETFSPYGLDVHSGNPFCSFPGKGYNDAIFWRNHCAFIQHAPSAATLQSIKIDKKIKSKIVRSNLIPAGLVYMGFPVTVILAARDIAPGEHLYFDYGAYWSNQQASGSGNGVYYVFDVRAKILGRITLDNKFKFNKSHTLKVPDAPLCKDNGETAVPVFEGSVKNPALNYQQNFINNVRYAIQLHLKRKPLGPVLEWLDRMSNLPAENSEDFYKEICLIVENTEFLKILMPLAKELMLFVEAFKMQKQLLNNNLAPEEDLSKKNTM